MSSIHYAAGRGDIYGLYALLEAGADPDEPSPNDGKTPLMKAAKQNNQVAAKLLLRFGADIDAVDHKGRTALFDAPHLQMKRLLLDAGADPDRGRIGGMTLLAFFGSFAHRDMVDLLIAYGADSAEKTREGRTVRELLDDPGFQWQPPPFPDTPKNRAGYAAAILKHSEDLTLSPEEFVARNRNIIIFGYHTFAYDDPSLEAWAKRVGELLASPELREAAYRKHLAGDELTEALRPLARERQRAEMRRQREKRLAEFERTVLNTLPP